MVPDKCLLQGHVVLSHFPTPVFPNICIPQQYCAPGIRGGIPVLSEGVEGGLVTLGKMTRKVAIALRRW